MHGICKIIFIVLCYIISSDCRALPSKLHPKQKQLDQVRSHNNTHKLSEGAPGIFNGVLNHDIPLGTSANRQGGSFGRVPSEKHSNEKDMKKRGLDVGIRVIYPTTQRNDFALDSLEEMVALANRLVQKKYDNTQNCPDCKEEEEVVIKRILQPAYTCDGWDPKRRICILERNMGDTVTFYLSTGKDERIHRPNITWKKEFHVRDNKERKEFVIDPQNPPENIIIGRRGFELSVSPITETDVENNMFSATIQAHPSSMSKVYFMIQVVAIDLGFVYVGETIELHLRKFFSLPEQSMSFKWYMEKDGEHGTPPSNMKVSITGDSIKISELRQEQEGILSCSVYTNLDVMATKKRFFLKDLSKNNKVLQHSPNHSLIFQEEEFRNKRDPKNLLPLLSSLRFSRQKRGRLTVDEVERALFPSTAINPRPVTIEEPVEELRILERPEPVNEVSSLQADVPVDEINAPDDKQVINWPDNLQMNVPNNRQITDQEDVLQMNPMDTPENGFARNPQQYLMNKSPSKNVPLLDVLINPSNLQQKQDIPQFVNQKQGMQYGDLNIQAKGSKPKQQDGFSDIVLNIGGIKETPKITAEMQIGMLLSNCFSDLECAPSATCVKSNLKKAGYCKCLPGTNGVGIFCRKAVWVSNNKFDIEEHESDNMEYPNASPPSG